MASLGSGHENSGERALIQRGVGLEAITIEQRPALAKLPCWQAVQIPRGMFTASRAILTILLLFLIVLEFVPWTQTISATGKVSAYTPYDRPQNIESRNTGRVKAWHIYEGVKVKKGDLVGELEDYDPTYMAPEILPLFEQRKEALEKTRQVPGRHGARAGRGEPAEQSGAGALFRAGVAEGHSLDFGVT